MNAQEIVSCYFNIDLNQDQYDLDIEYPAITESNAGAFVRLARFGESGVCGCVAKHFRGMPISMDNITILEHESPFINGIDHKLFIKFQCNHNIFYMASTVFCNDNPNWDVCFITRRDDWYSIKIYAYLTLPDAKQKYDSL